MSKVSYTLMALNEMLEVTHPDGSVVHMRRRELLDLFYRYDFIYTEGDGCYTVHGDGFDYEIEVGVL